MWSEMIIYFIHPNFPGRVPILWVSMHSVPVSHKIWLGTSNIQDIPIHKDELEDFMFATLGENTERVGQPPTSQREEIVGEQQICRFVSL